MSRLRTLVAIGLAPSVCAVFALPPFFVGRYYRPWAPFALSGLFLFTFASAINLATACYRQRRARLDPFQSASSQWFPGICLAYGLAGFCGFAAAFDSGIL